jgi:hypothetical protein
MAVLSVSAGGFEGEAGFHGAVGSMVETPPSGSFIIPDRGEEMVSPKTECVVRK